MRFFLRITRVLDAIYLCAGVLAGVFLVMIGVLVLAQVLARMLGATAPGADQFAGYCLSASSFLALAYTLRHNAHIRVSLILDRLSGRMRLAFEVWCLLIATVMSSFFAWYAISMTRRSYELGERTIGLMPIPIWIPQTGMAIGVALLALAFFEALLTVLAGHRPFYDRESATSIEDRAGEAGA